MAMAEHIQQCLHVLFQMMSDRGYHSFEDNLDVCNIHMNPLQEYLYQLTTTKKSDLNDLLHVEVNLKEENKSIRPTEKLLSMSSGRESRVSGIFVYNTWSKRFLKEEEIEAEKYGFHISIFSVNDLQINVGRAHKILSYASKHSIVHDPERSTMLERYTMSDMPIISMHDPQALYLGLWPGQLIKINRKYAEPYYRIVTDLRPVLSLTCPKGALFDNGDDSGASIDDAIASFESLCLEEKESVVATILSASAKKKLKNELKLPNKNKSKPKASKKPTKVSKKIKSKVDDKNKSPVVIKMSKGQTKSPVVRKMIETQNKSPLLFEMIEDRKKSPILFKIKKL